MFSLACFAVPGSLAARDARVSQVTCGARHTVLILAGSGQLWTQGSGTCGQLGLGSTLSSLQFRRLEQVGLLFQFVFVYCPFSLSFL